MSLVFSVCPGVTLWKMLFPYKSTAVKSQGKSHRHAQKFLSPRTLQQQKKAGDKARETGKGKRSRKKTKTQEQEQEGHGGMGMCHSQGRGEGKSWWGCTRGNGEGSENVRWVCFQERNILDCRDIRCRCSKVRVKRVNSDRNETSQPDQSQGDRKKVWIKSSSEKQAFPWQGVVRYREHIGSYSGGFGTK